MLLPASFDPAAAPEALVALDPSGRLVGAAALTWIATGDPAAFPVAVHVLPQHRRQGIGRTLIDAAAAFASADAPALQPFTAPREGSPEAAFCLGAGFALDHRILHFAGEAEAMEAMLGSYRQKLDAAGYIPAGARVIALAEAPLAEVATLIAQEFRGNPVQVLARLQGRTGSTPDAKRSVVLLLDGRVIGAQLVTIAADGLPEVEANAVHPDWRRGWANLLLTHEGTRAGVRHGSRRFRFFCDERVIDTVKLARRSGAAQTHAHLALRKTVG